MSKQEVAELLAQLNALTPSRRISEGVQKMGLRIKDRILTALARGTQFFSASLSARIDALNKAFDWDASTTAKAIEDSKLSLLQLNEPALRAELRNLLFELGKLRQSVDDAALAHAIISRAAKSLKIRNAEHYTNLVDLETAVLSAWLEELKKELQKLSATRAEELERKLRNELAKLTKSDENAIRKALGIDKVSAEGIVSFLRTGATTLTAQTLISSCGFGAFLFLSTALKATGLLFGTTFAFGTYTTASSSLAFLLSPSFFLLILAITGGMVTWRASNQLDDYKAQLLVVMGRSRLAAAARKRGWRRWVEAIGIWPSSIWHWLRAKFATRPRARPNAPLFTVENRGVRSKRAI